MKIIYTLAVALTALTIASNASAQVAIEGNSNFKATARGPNISWSATIGRLSNYNYTEVSPVALALVISRSCASSGNLSGTTVASTRKYTLAARTYYENIPVKGTSGKPSGKFCAHILALSGSKILAHAVFPKNYSFRTFGSGNAERGLPQDGTSSFKEARLK